MHNGRMNGAKAMTIRLSPEQAEQLATVAGVDDVPVAEVIRAAIAEHVEARTKDAQFRQSLQERIERAHRCSVPESPPYSTEMHRDRSDEGFEDVIG